MIRHYILAGLTALFAFAAFGALIIGNFIAAWLAFAVALGLSLKITNDEKGRY